jgi:hypothetical protein
MLYLTLRFLHIAAMTLWFTGQLFLPGDARRTIASNGDLDALAVRIARGGAVAAIGAVSTILLGFALIFVLGGFAAVPLGINIGMGLGLLAWLVGVTGGRISGNRLIAAIAAKADQATLAGHARKLAMWAGIFQLLWGLTLACMVFRNVI